MSSYCIKLNFLLSLSDIRHPEELSLLRKPREPKKKKKKLEEIEDDLELEDLLLTPGSGKLMDTNWYIEREFTHANTSLSIKF